LKCPFSGAFSFNPECDTSKSGKWVRGVAIGLEKDGFGFRP